MDAIPPAAAFATALTAIGRAPQGHREATTETAGAASPPGANGLARGAGGRHVGG